MFKKWRSRRKAKRTARQDRRQERVTMRNETRRITGGLGGAIKSIGSVITPLLGGGGGNPAMSKGLDDGYQGETGGQSNMLWYGIAAAVVLFMFKDKIFGR